MPIPRYIPDKDGTIEEYVRRLMEKKINEMKDVGVDDNEGHENRMIDEDNMAD